MSLNTITNKFNYLWDLNITTLRKCWFKLKDSQVTQSLKLLLSERKQLYTKQQIKN